MLARGRAMLLMADDHVESSRLSQTDDPLGGVVLAMAFVVASGLCLALVGVGFRGKSGAREGRRQDR